MRAGLLLVTSVLFCACVLVGISGGNTTNNDEELNGTTTVIGTVVTITSAPAGNTGQVTTIAESGNTGSAAPSVTEDTSSKNTHVASISGTNDSQTLVATTEAAQTTIRGSNITMLTTLSPIATTTAIISNQTANQTAAPYTSDQTTTIQNTNIEQTTLNTTGNETTAFNQSTTAATISSHQTTDNIPPSVSDNNQIKRRNETTPVTDGSVSLTPLPNVTNGEERNGTDSATVDPGGGSTAAKKSDDIIRMTIQNQIYLVSGVIGGVVFILLLLVIALAVTVSRLKDKIDTVNWNSPSVTPSVKPNYAYTNNAYEESMPTESRRNIAPSEELSMRGFSQYNGNPQGRHYGRLSRPQSLDEPLRMADSRPDRRLGTSSYNDPPPRSPDRKNSYYEDQSPPRRNYRY